MQSLGGGLHRGLHPQHPILGSNPGWCLPGGGRPLSRTCSAVKKGTASGTTSKGSSRTTTSSRSTISMKPKTLGTRKESGSSKVRRAASPPEDEDPLERKPRLNQFYAFITGFPFPLGPTFTRRTCRYEVEKGTVWTFEQTQALELFNVFIPVRMTVIKLKSGGLWVHAPVAPTAECVRLVKELGAPVEYIVLPTYAYEHKAFVGPFSRAFPKAKVYVTPYQWSFPLNLPLQFFGIFPDGELKSDDPDAPWADEIEQKLFAPPPISSAGKFIRLTEMAFFHKRTKTLMVTDALLRVTEKVPDVIPKYALLEIARDGLLNRSIAGDRTPEEVKQIAKPQPAPDTLESRIRGWKRMALLVLYFGPSNLLEPEASFAAVANRLIVGPVVETLVFSKVPATTRRWVDSICNNWDFNKVIPCHFDGPIPAKPADVKRAFTFAYEMTEDLDEESKPAKNGGVLGWFTSLFKKEEKLVRPVVFPAADIKALTDLNQLLIKTGVVKVKAD
mmetsp:Transcript_11526/g.31413  ORF Transcript_11526/g.31413 Transcript_11526/m.31413 type:complete len:502 (+) Transcript_11526:120-1625(+)